MSQDARAHLVSLIRRALEWRMYQIDAGPGFEVERRNAKRRLDYHLDRAASDPIDRVRLTVEVVGLADLVREIHGDEPPPRRGR